MSKKPSPVLQALVLADHIYTDERGKRIICGTYSQIRLPRFPAMFGRSTWAFILLADVIGTAVLQLRFVHLKDFRVLMRSSEITLQSEDRLIPLDVAIEVPPLPLPEPGMYGVECYVDAELIGSVRLQAIQAQAPGGNQDD